MKHLKRFNEAIIDYESDNIKGFYEELKRSVESLPRNRFELPLKDVAEIGQKYNIEVVDYDSFYNELPEDEKKTAPPRRGTPAFALINAANKNTIRLVLCERGVNDMMLDHIYHMLKHENVHVGQLSNQKIPYKLPNSNDKKAYFSDKMEIMAFAQSISDMLMDENPKSVKDAIKELRFNPLWRDIKKAEVGEEVLNRYKKYIYLYLEKEFEKPEDQRKRVRRRMGPPPGMGMPPGMRGMPPMGMPPGMRGMPMGMPPGIFKN